MRLFLLLVLISLFFSAGAQNSPYIWKHTCNCGPSGLLVKDANNNTYTITESSPSPPLVIKLSPSGQEKFRLGFLPVNYTAMQFRNALYSNGSIYLAATVDNSNVSSRLYLLKVDTLGMLLDSMVVDSVGINVIAGIQNMPYYSVGMTMDQFNHLHIGFSKQNQSFQTYYNLLKFDQNFALLNYYQDSLGWSSTPGPFYVTSGGNVYYTVTGSLKKVNATHTGVEWSYPLNGNQETGTQIEADNNGNIWFTSVEYGSQNTYHLYKLTDTGPGYVYNFSVPVRSSSNTLDMHNLNMNPADNSVWVAGGEYTAFPARRFVKKYNASSGSLIGQDSAYDYYIQSLLFDANNNLLAIGGGDNYYVWIYNSTGSLASTIVYDAPCGANDGITAAVTDNTGKLVVTGAACENSNTISWATTLKYTLPVITTSLQENMASRFSVFPVPARDRIYILNLPEIEQIVITGPDGKVYQVKMNSDAGIDISHLNSGIYSLSVKARGVHVQTRFIKIF